MVKLRPLLNNFIYKALYVICSRNLNPENQVLKLLKQLQNSEKGMNKLVFNVYTLENVIRKVECSVEIVM